MLSPEEYERACREQEALDDMIGRIASGETFGNDGWRWPLREAIWEWMSSYEDADRDLAAKLATNPACIPDSLVPYIEAQAAKEIANEDASNQSY